MTLLSLVMIVKNEAYSIAKTISSARPLIDYALILDTGSTDGTQKLAHEALGETPHDIPEEPFIDFATSRNRAFDLESGRSEFALVLCGDLQVHTRGDPLALRSLLETTTEDALYVSCHMGSYEYDMARISRTSAKWRYVGVVHEVLCKEGKPPPTLRVPDLWIDYDMSRRTMEHMRASWLAHLALLLAEHEKHPSDARTVFYLAQTYECLGDYRKAYLTYQERISLGGWHEEIYESLFRKASCSEKSGRPWPEVKERYLAAYAYSPHRAEPLYEIARYYATHQEWAHCLVYAKAAAGIPFPSRDRLFVNSYVYNGKIDVLMTQARKGLGAVDAVPK